MYIYMYIYICIYVCMCVYECMRAYIYIYICIYMHACIHSYTHTHSHARTHARTHVHAHAYKYNHELTRSMIYLGELINNVNNHCKIQHAMTHFVYNFTTYNDCTCSYWRFPFKISISPVETSLENSPIIRVLEASLHFPAVHNCCHGVDVISGTANHRIIFGPFFRFLNTSFGFIRAK